MPELERRARLVQAKLRATGPVPVDVAWERYADPSQWSQWSPQIRTVETDAARLDAGMRGVVRPVAGPGIRFRVIDVGRVGDELFWAWVVLPPLLPTLGLRHGVRSIDREGRRLTETTLDMAGPLPLVLAYAPLALWALHRLVNLPVS